MEIALRSCSAAGSHGYSVSSSMAITTREVGSACPMHINLELGRVYVHNSVFFRYLIVWAGRPAIDIPFDGTLHWRAYILLAHIYVFWFVTDHFRFPSFVPRIKTNDWALDTEPGAGKFLPTASLLEPNVLCRRYQLSALVLCQGGESMLWSR